MTLNDKFITELATAKLSGDDMTIVLLCAREDLRVTDLARLTGRKVANVSKSCRRLRDKGILVLHEDKGRFLRTDQKWKNDQVAGQMTLDLVVSN